MDEVEEEESGEAEAGEEGGEEAGEEAGMQERGTVIKKHFDI